MPSAETPKMSRDIDSEAVLLTVRRRHRRWALPFSAERARDESWTHEEFSRPACNRVDPPNSEVGWRVRSQLDGPTVTRRTEGVAAARLHGPSVRVACEGSDGAIGLGRRPPPSSCASPSPIPPRSGRGFSCSDALCRARDPLWLLTPHVRPGRVAYA